MPHTTRIDEDADETGAGELILYIDNDEPLYRRKMFMHKNLAGKRASGVYDHSKAPKMFRHLVDEAARKYTKEFGTEGDRIFLPHTRQHAAEELAERFLQADRQGEHVMLLPIKYRPKTAKPSKASVAKRAGDLHRTLGKIRS